jgi:hypothetical protein
LFVSIGGILLLLPSSYTPKKGGAWSPPREKGSIKAKEEDSHTIDK